MGSEIIESLISPDDFNRSHGHRDIKLTQSDHWVTICAQYCLTYAVMICRNVNRVHSLSRLG